MRVLMDDYGYQWDKAHDIVTAVMSYTNHTVMSEALERWPVEYVQKLLPRIYMIIDEINGRYGHYIYERYPNESNLWYDTRIIDNGVIHMARLAVIMSHTINGVAEIHSGLLTTDLFRDYYRMWPDRFQNKTNGITPRRWMLYSNPQLRNLLDETIGKGYEKDFDKIIDLMKYVDDPEVQKKFLAVKQERKEILATYIRRATGVEVDPHSIFDSQAKRLHAYKRQLLNIMQ
jgi:starch phosphorylase